MTPKLLITVAALTVCAPQAFADDVFTDDVIISGPGGGSPGRLCVGRSCVDGESFATTTFDAVMKMSGNNVLIEFDDDSNSPFPDRDWSIQINETNGGDDGEAFLINDVTSSTTPFTISGGAPENALFVASDGDIGMGTSLPTTSLHIVDVGLAGLRLESTSFSGDWELGSGLFGLFFTDKNSLSDPFQIRNGAPEAALVIRGTGNIGLGTDTPEAPLEVYSNDSFNFFRITAAGAAVNESVDITFTSGPLGTGQLRYNIVDGDNQEMSLDADGNMVLDGTLTTAGPTCAGGCDRVFDADYALPSITDHAAQMFAVGHLPSVGPTLPGQPVNVTEQMGGMLNALEHAHIYIDQLHGEMSQMQGAFEAERNRADILAAQLSTVIARLDAIEAQ